MTSAQYKRLIAAARKAAADEDEARWMARLEAASWPDLKAPRRYAPRRELRGPDLSTTVCRPQVQDGEELPPVAATVPSSHQPK